MEAYASPNHQYAQNQLRSFVSLEDDDEMTQLILEELAMPRRSSFVNVIATMAASPSSKSENGLNAIVEEDQSADE
ncbi:hypothetical protein Poli38472_002555 [Pythium oligandrum]|uniref:Uncharacterized protein n=1 Tax=Pythium oligandrum TaxID=41045 RepID=A0A8K1FJY0_PYTOL|nr:hypothetical protein Poli38472_002555 [Pythium oligandrum]|eukprot:TMW63614.1 hypothetical protein Poli38472_002555 [Pythium oligandrum]